MAPAINDPDFPEHRKGESNVERSLRQRDIDVYMPSHWIEYQNRRTHQTISRRLPLLVGYAFVYIEPAQFERVRLTDGVLSFLRMSMDTGPQRFSETEISKLMVDEFEASQRAKLEEHMRLEEIRIGRVEELTRSLKRSIPKGRAVRINMRAQANIAIEKMDGAARDRVQKILAELDELTGDPVETRKAA